MTMTSSDAAVKTEDLFHSDTIRYLVSIKDDVHDRSQIPHRDQVYRRVFAENPDDLQALKFAKAFAAFLAEKKIFIHPRDILAGFTYRYTYGTTIPVDMPDDYDPLYRPPVMPDSQREYETVLLHHGRVLGDVQADALETQGRTLMDYVRETYNYRPDRVARALDALDGEEG